MKLNVMTASSTMNYLTKIQNHTLFSVSLVLELHMDEARDIVRGYRPFTKNEYLRLVQEYEELEFKIEYFENVPKAKEK